MYVFHMRNLDAVGAAHILSHWSSSIQKIAKKFVTMSDRRHHISKYLPDLIMHESVYIVGYCPPAKDIATLRERTDNITIIDNDPTSAELLKSEGVNVIRYAHERSRIPEGTKFSIRGVIDEEMSLTEAAWDYLLNRGIKRINDLGRPYPYAVRLLTDYHLRKGEYGEDGKLFYIGMEALRPDVKSFIWDEVLTDLSLVNRLVFDGRAIEEYKKINVMKLIDDIGYGLNFRGYKTMVLNTDVEDVRWIYDWDQFHKYDMLMSYVYNGDGFTIRLFALKDTINLYEIAREFKPVGTPHEVEFRVDKDGFMDWEKFRKEEYLTRRVGIFKIIVPMKLDVQFVDDAWRMGIEEIGIYAEHEDARVCRKLLKDRVVRIIRGIRAGISAAEINPFWTMEDVETALGYFRKHLLAVK